MFKPKRICNTYNPENKTNKSIVKRQKTTDNLLEKILKTQRFAHVTKWCALCVVGCKLKLLNFCFVTVKATKVKALTLTFSSFDSWRKEHSRSAHLNLAS